MAHLDPKLIHMNFVAEVLKPIKVVCWGELALGYLGVPTVVASYMLGIADNEMDAAREKLLGAEFQQQNWSFASEFDPETRKHEAMLYEVHTELAQDYAYFDKHTMRFGYPDISRLTNKIVLIPLSYMYLDAPTPSNTLVGKDNSTVQPTYYISRSVYDCDNLYFPNAIVLLESIIKVILDHDLDQTLRAGLFRRHLQVWAIGYLYGMLNLRDDVLDCCKNNDVKTYFNEQIKKANRPQDIEDRTVFKNKTQREFLTNDLIKDFQ